MKLHKDDLDFSSEIQKLQLDVKKLVDENNRLKELLYKSNGENTNQEQTLNMIPVPLFQTDELGKIIHINPETKKLLEIQNEVDTPTDIFQLLKNEDVKIAKTNFSKVLQGEDIPPSIYTAVTKSGHEIKLVIKSNRYSNNNSTTGIIGTILDASKEKETINHINETEQRYDRLIEQSDDAIFLMCDGKMRILNSGFTRMLGYTIDDVDSIDFDISNLVSKKSFDKVKSILCDHKSGKHLLEFVAINKKGERIDCEVSIVSFEYNNEKYIQGIIRDISKRKHAENELRKTKSFLQAAIEQSPAGILIADANSKNIRIANQAALDIFGFNGEESRNAFKLFEKFEWKFLTKDGEFINDPLNIVISKGENFKNEEVIIVDRLGNERWLSINAAPIFDPSKEIVAGVMVLMDISEQKLAEQDIRRSEELFRGIYENASVGIFRISREGKQNLANPALLNLLGYNNEIELLKDTGNRWLPSVKAFIRFLDRRCLKNNDKCIFKREFTKPNGEKIVCSTLVRRIEEIPGEKYYYEGVVEDITNQKAAEQALIEAKENAEKSDRLKSEFLAQMSHEIRTPINTILSFSSLVEEEIADKVSEELEMSFDYISRSGNRIIRTIDLILHMSELQTGNYEYVISTFDLHKDILENLYPEYLMTAKEKRIKFSITNSINDPIINGDKSSVTRIFHNLIENAIKYTKEGEVCVNVTQTTNSKLMVEVKDTGIGIAEDYLDSLFKPFSQEDQGYTRKFEGNGLGLALVNKYVELNDAKIEVESEKGKGSIFRVIFN